MHYSAKFLDQEEEEVVTTNVVERSLGTQPAAPYQEALTEKKLAPSFSELELAAANSTSDPSAYLAPYINRSTLKYLEPDMLENNIQVRHDLVLESGYKASLRESSNMQHIKDDYWDAIRLEIAELSFPDITDAPKLRVLIFEIREVMLDLYPRCDVVKEELVELFDDQFIIQQIKHGLFEIDLIFQFLAGTMKKNCAPKRDAMVDSMAAAASNGEYINALEICLELLELMKLDLANYRLDVIRPTVIKTAIATERAYFKSVVENKKMSLQLTKQWLSDNGSDAPSLAKGNPKEKPMFQMFIDASIRLLVNPFVRDQCVPETFVLDKRRLMNMHGQFQDLCIVQCLLLIFKQMVGNSAMAKDHCVLLKQELLVALSSPDAQISLLSGLIAKYVAMAKGLVVVDSAMAAKVHGFINKIVAPDNALFLAVEKKLCDHIRQNFSDANKSGLFGLTEFNILDRLDELEKNFMLLILYNWQVFEPVYIDLLEKLMK